MARAPTAAQPTGTSLGGDRLARDCVDLTLPPGFSPGFDSNLEDFPVGELVPGEPDPGLPDTFRQQLLEVVPHDPRVADQHRLVHAKPSGEADVLVELARSEQVDAIVVGTHGRRGLAKLVSGSVAEPVRRLAPCPVVAVKVPAEQLREDEPTTR